MDCNQVPATQRIKEPEKAVLGQIDSSKTRKSRDRRAHKTVKHVSSRTSRKKGIRKGGWDKTRYLTHEEFRQAQADAYAIHVAGFEWTVFISIRPEEGLTDRQKQDRIQQVLDRFCTALKRRGVPFVLMRVYEKKRGGGSLHGHALLHVPRQHFDVIERIADRFDRVARKVRIEEEAPIEIHARVIGQSPDDLRKAILYPLKQHEWAGPGNDGAGSARMFYQQGDPVRGRRIAFSRHARAILDEYRRTLPGTVSARPEAVLEPIIIPIQLAEPVQLALPIDAPPVDVIALLENKRQTLHLPQRVVAHQLGGLKQAGYANWVRGHDRLSPWRRNRALEWLRAA
jgi:hypothetical protein